MTDEPTLFGVLYSQGRKFGILVTDTEMNAYKIFQLLRKGESNPDMNGIVERNIAALIVADIPFDAEKIATDNRYGRIQIISLITPERHTVQEKKRLFRLWNREAMA